MKFCELKLGDRHGSILNGKHCWGEGGIVLLWLAFIFTFHKLDGKISINLPIKEE
mgnify:CR=1 FL=1